MADKVLIVDDDQAVSSILYKVVKSNGIDADTVSSGEEALKILSSHPYDLILLDINMHGMDGFEVIQTIRRRGLKTPIIIVSGRKEDFDTLYGLDIGSQSDQTVQPGHFGSQSQSPHPTQQKPPSGCRDADYRRTIFL